MPNRTTVKNNIVAQNVPTVTNAILTGMLNTELADNVKFREDVAVTQSSGASNITVNFTGRDRIDLTRTGGTLVITVAGIGDGETVFLIVTKTAGQPVTWIGVTDITPIKSNADALSLVLYEIVRKGANYFAKAWVESVKQATDTILGVAEIATASECNALSDVTRMVTPGRIPIATTTQRGIQELATVAESNALTDAARLVTPGTIPLATTTQRGVVELATNAETLAGTDATKAVTPDSLQSPAWNSFTLGSGWLGNVYYFKDAIGNVHVKTSNLYRTTNIGGDDTDSATFGTMPTGYKPASQHNFLATSLEGNAIRHHTLKIDVNSNSISPDPQDYIADSLINFYVIYRAL